MTWKNATLASLFSVGLIAQPKPTPALACNMKAISSTERVRYNGLTANIKRAVRLQSELKDGFSWDLDGKKVTMVEAAEWMSMERRCCPFLTLQIEAAGDGSDFKVKLLGPDGVKSFLQSEFGTPGGR